MQIKISDSISIGRHRQQGIRISLSLLLKLSARCELIFPNFAVYVVKKLHEISW